MTDTKTIAPKMTYIRNDDGAFVCPECGEIKTRQNTMFYHMKKHAGEAARMHVCTEPGCGKAFIQKSGLQQHMIQTHPVEGQAVWSCPAEGCDHVCRMKANLIIHIGRKHGGGWIPSLAEETKECTGCKKTFASPTAYYYHAATCFTAPAIFASVVKSTQV